MSMCVGSLVLLILDVIAAAITVGVGALIVDSVFFREIRETEIRLDDFVNNANVLFKGEIPTPIGTPKENL